MKRVLTVIGMLLVATSVATAQPIKVGSKNFTEQFIVAEIYAQALEKAGFEVERHLNLGTTLIAHTAIVNGDIDLYPEYTGTALAAVMKGELRGSADEIYAKVKSYYESNFKLAVLQATNINNGYAIVVTPQTAAQHNLNTLSDLASVSRELTLAGEAGYDERADGLPGLKGTYGITFKQFRVFAKANLRYTALASGNVDVTYGYSTDWQIADRNLKVLDDNKHLFPPYFLVPVVRDDVLAQNPGIARALNAISPLLTNERMRSMNAEVDRDRREPADVAAEFLKQFAR